MFQIFCLQYMAKKTHATEKRQLFQLCRHFAGKIFILALDSFTEFKALHARDLNSRTHILCGLLKNG